MVHAFLLFTDDIVNKSNKFYASRFDVSIVRSMLSHAYVPDIVLRVCEALRPHFLKSRELQFIASHASFIFEYDIHRIVPPSLFIQAHDVLNSTPNRSHIYKQWLVSNIIRYGEATYKVANLIGGIYQTEGDFVPTSHYHSNWFLDSLAWLTCTNPSNYLYNYQVPIETAQHYNPYIHLLMLEDANIFQTVQFIKHSSRIFEENKAFCAGSIFNIVLSSSSAIVTHQLQAPQAPTWISNPFNFLSLQSHISEGTREEFCKSVNFHSPSSSDNRTEIQRGVDFAYDVMSWGSEVSDNMQMPIFLNDWVLLVDPYANDPSPTTFFCGTVICNGNIDGISLPLPNIDCFKTHNSRINSFGILLTNVVPEFKPIQGPTFTREVSRDGIMPTLALLYDYGRILIQKTPLFTTPFRIEDLELPIIERNIVQNTNVIGSVVEVEEKDVKPNKAVFWSSYRHIDTKFRPCASNVRMFPSLEGIYGMTGSIWESLPLHNILPQL